MAAGESILEARGAGYRIGAKSIVENIQLSIAEGESVVLLGPNGSGKTTLLRMLSGVRRATEGGVLLHQRDLFSYSRPEVACHLAYMPQNTWTEFDIKVMDVVAMGRFPHVGAWRSLTKADHDAIASAMEQTGVQDIAQRLLPTLSGGERQRVFLARALAQGSPILILDEPTSSLDIGHQLEFIDILQKLHAGGKTILAAVHDLRLACEQFPRAVLLDHGRIAADGPTRDVITGQAASRAFGVRIDWTSPMQFTRR